MSNCSDQTVNRKDDDEAISQPSDIPFPVSNDVNEIAEFMKGDKDQVIFSTYQSSPLIAEAQKHPSVPPLDLVIADEAHRCAGKSDTVFGTVLDDQKIKADKRLFATATPRIYRTSLKKAADEFGVEVVDMNDEKSFGKRFHTLTFGEAIKREQLTDYRVLIVGVDDERINEWIATRRLVSTDTGLATDARSLAGQIGLLKAIKDWNLHRLISFHSRVKGARLFSEDIVQVAEWLDDVHRPSGHLRAEFVSGDMPTIERRQKLMRLKNVGNGDIGLLSNAKCLSEGVDVPALDGVAFIDPRSSEIDIIQSVGRAIRLSENKTMGTIVIPVFIEQTENPEQALAASDFRPIWDVLEALKSHDERLSDELDQLRIELGAKRRRSVGVSDLTKIVFDLPTSVNETFARSLRARLVEKTTESWMFWFGLLEKFVEERGNSKVVGSYKTEAGYALGSWVTTQRALETQMEPDRRRRLETLPGWSWDPKLERWEEGFAKLVQFSKQNGHSKVALGYQSDDGYPLGNWVQTNRYSEALDRDRRQRLEALPGWSWDPHSQIWEEGFAHLRRFADQHGHCRVHFSFRTEGFRLGAWVTVQRMRASQEANSYSAMGIDPDRRNRLEALPGWSWDVSKAKWQERYACLTEFLKREGHCQVPTKYKTDDGVLLGQWVGRQKTLFSRGRLEPDRRQRLEALLGWVWPRQSNERGQDFADRFGAQWENSFAALKQFSEREGHCRISSRYKTGDEYTLRIWVMHQREKQVDGTLNPDRQQRLEALPDWSWTPESDRHKALWEKRFASLRHFSERERHSQVPSGYKTDDGVLLGPWVNRQRILQNTMEPNRKQRLEALPGWVWNIESDKLKAAWEEGLANLKQFSEREGHCRVPFYLQTDEGFRLGAWVSRQRRTFKADKLHLDRRQRLEALPGWVWDKAKNSHQRG
jgi:hypothetical protein